MTNMNKVYTFNDNFNFTDLESLARHFAEVIAKIEKIRDKDFAAIGQLTLEAGDTHHGDTWYVECNEID